MRCGIVGMGTRSVGANSGKTPTIAHVPMEIVHRVPPANGDYEKVPRGGGRFRHRMTWPPGRVDDPIASPAAGSRGVRTQVVGLLSVSVMSSFHAAKWGTRMKLER